VSFARRLAETIAWCSPRATREDPARGLRSPRLRPADFDAAFKEVSGRIDRTLEATHPIGPALPASAPRAARHRWEAILEQQRIARSHQWSRLYQAEMPQVEAERERIVDALAEERARLLRLNHAYPSDQELHGPAIDQAGGRLLLCGGISESVWDGAAAAESGGFFDGDDLAPWDTWICYVPERAADEGGVARRSRIVSWAPPALLDLIAAGIHVNPVDCISWADDAFDPERR